MKTWIVNLVTDGQAPIVQDIKGAQIVRAIDCKEVEAAAHIFNNETQEYQLFNYQPYELIASFPYAHVRGIYPKVTP